MLQELTREVATHYRRDKIAPGVVVAWLSARGTYYASVRRYGVATQRVLRANVVTAYESTSYDAAVKGLVLNWRRVVRSERRLTTPLKRKIVHPAYRVPDEMDRHWEERPEW